MVRSDKKNMYDSCTTNSGDVYEKRQKSYRKGLKVVQVLEIDTQKPFGSRRLKMAEFKDRLKELRTNRGLSQDRLSEATGFSKETISAWERGKRNPSPENVEALSGFFEIDVEYLSGESNTLRMPEEAGYERNWNDPSRCGEMFDRLLSLTDRSKETLFKDIERLYEAEKRLGLIKKPTRRCVKVFVDRNGD